jgi:hypothetical protein
MLCVFASIGSCPRRVGKQVLSFKAQVPFNPYHYVDSKMRAYLCESSNVDRYKGRGRARSFRGEPFGELLYQRNALRRTMASSICRVNSKAGG